MSSAQPPKLNYAKARQKSKAKNEPESQEKISFEGESSTDIFAHLNQDNLNYIKKELKNKKSHRDQKPKLTQETKIQPIKPELQVETQKFDIYKQKHEKYKNEIEISQRDSHEQETLRGTEVDDSIVSKNESSEYKGNIFKPVIFSSQQKPKQKQKEIVSKQHQKSRYLGLEPPLLTYNVQKQGLVSSQSQHMNQLTASLQIHRKQKRNESLNLHQRNPFHQYELKSQASNNPATSTVSVQNHLSQDLSANFRPSQFIDRLQNYIEELKFTPEKQKQNNMSDYSPTSSLQKQRNEEKRFMKDKSKKYDNYGSITNGKGIMISQRSDASRPYRGDDSLRRQKQNVQLYEQYEKGFQKFEKPNMIRNYKFGPQNVNHEIFNNDSQKFEDLHKELSKEKNYGIKLALQLQKYKQNEVKYQRQVSFLHKSIENLKLQLLSLKSSQDQQAQDTKKILAFISKQNEIQSKNKKNAYVHEQEKLSSIENQPFAHQYSSLKYSDAHQKKYWTQNQNQFQKFMKFSQFEAPYVDLNPAILEKLNQQFKKGQNSYRSNGFNRNPLSDLNIPLDFANHQKRTKHQYNDQDQANEDQEFINQMLNFKQYRKEFSPKRRSDSLRKLKEKVEILTERNSPPKIDRKVAAKSSLEKLKEEYELFKAKTRLSRHKQNRNQEW